MTPAQTRLEAALEALKDAEYIDEHQSIEVSQPDALKILFYARALLAELKAGDLGQVVPLNADVYTTAFRHTDCISEKGFVDMLKSNKRYEPILGQTGQLIFLPDAKGTKT